MSAFKFLKEISEDVNVSTDDLGYLTKWFFQENNKNNYFTRVKKNCEIGFFDKSNKINNILNKYIN